MNQRLRDQKRFAATATAGALLVSLSVIVLIAWSQSLEIADFSPDKQNPFERDDASDVNPWLPECQKRIKRAWLWHRNSTSWTTRSPVVFVKLNLDGSFRCSKLVRSSGDSADDELALNIVEASSPLPEPNYVAYNCGLLVEFLDYPNMKLSFGGGLRRANQFEWLEVSQRRIEQVARRDVSTDCVPTRQTMSGMFKLGKDGFMHPATNPCSPKSNSIERELRRAGPFPKPPSQWWYKQKFLVELSNQHAWKICFAPRTNLNSE